MKRIITVTVALSALAAGGCGGDQPSVPPVCQSLAATENTVEHIRNTDVSENGIAQLRTYLTQLRTNATQLYTDAKAQFAPQAQQLRTAMDQLSASVDTAKVTPDVVSLSAVRTSVAAVRTSTQNLHAAMAETC